MQCRKVVIWWLINGKEAGLLSRKEREIKSLRAIVNALFPGVNYYSLTGFEKIMRERVIPVLKKWFPDLESTPSKSIEKKETVEIGEFLPSKGYEWQDSAKWQSKFRKLLRAN